LGRPEGTGFDHLVVLMFENRSFDNLLGYLYSATTVPVPTGQHFEGLQEQHENTAPDGSVVSTHPYDGPTDAVMMSPQPDPGEEYPYVNTQLFGVVDPVANADHDMDRLAKPFNAPTAGTVPTMEGFVRDYVDKWRGEHDGKEPTPEEYDVIMGSFLPEMLPVFSTLARNFAIYDHWHAAVPSQTFCNRSFFHASTSHGFVTNAANGGYKKWLAPPEGAAPTIFNRLEEAGIAWAVYYDERQLISLTGLIHSPELEKYWSTRFFTMATFREHAAAGTLPAYSFIEPRLLYDHNDMHPPVGPATSVDMDGHVIDGGGISDVRAGDALLHDVYTAIRTSASATGSNAMNTVLAVTFDEHGGTYDHVPPPAAVPPTTGGETSTEMNFAFDRLGVRVPAMVISAYTPAGVVINDPMHHGAVISTLCQRHGLTPLTARDDGAPTLNNAITLATARHPSTWPTTSPLYVPKNPESGTPIHSGEGERPLSPPGVGLMGLLVGKYGAPGDPVPKTYREASDEVQKHGRGLFGS
ncbi:MAG: hypothetical protein JWQ43_2869, partial [Glaciihabitans sp.]|nr:hypothetical protein [Glaciihabitans sp.]